MKYRKVLSALILATTLTAVCLASSPVEQAESSAQQKYLEAVSENGNFDKVLEAEKVYEELIKNQGEKLPYQFRLASLTSIKAKYAFWPHEKMGYANEGIRMFDALERKIQAVKDKDVLYEFYLYRGQTYIHFPKFFNKFAIGLKDFEQATQLAESLGRPKQELASLYFTYAKYLKKEKVTEKAKHFAQRALDNDLPEKDRKEAQKITSLKTSYIVR